MQRGDADMQDGVRDEQQAGAERGLDGATSEHQDPSALRDLVGVRRGDMPPFYYERRGDGAPLWVFLKEEPYLTYLVGYNVSSVDESGDVRSRESPSSLIENAEVLDLAAFPHIRVPADKLSQLIRVLESVQSGISVVVIEPDAEDGRHPRILSNLVAERHYGPSYEVRGGSE